VKTTEKLVVGVAGMPGAGKSVALNTARQMGYPIVVMGDEIREEAKRRGLEPTPENLGNLMLKLREEEGEAAVAKRCFPKIEGADQPVVFVDGVRSLHEVEEFKRHFPFVLLAIHASPKTRFKRLSKRKRSDAPRSWESFRNRDFRELKVGLGNVIALADHLIVNEGSIEEFKAKVHKFLEEVTNYGQDNS